jgi:hypothetical protein
VIRVDENMIEGLRTGGAGRVNIWPDLVSRDNLVPLTLDDQQRASLETIHVSSKVEAGLIGKDLSLLVPAGVATEPRNG